jgi:hypothetical protein
MTEGTICPVEVGADENEAERAPSPAAGAAGRWPTPTPLDTHQDGHRPPSAPNSAALRYSAPDSALSPRRTTPSPCDRRVFTRPRPAADIDSACFPHDRGASSARIGQSAGGRTGGHIMRKQAIVLPTALASAARGRAAELTVWWDKGFYAQEDEAIAEVIAVFERKTGKRAKLAQLSRGGACQQDRGGTRDWSATRHCLRPVDSRKHRAMGFR